MCLAPQTGNALFFLNLRPGCLNIVSIVGNNPPNAHTQCLEEINQSCNVLTKDRGGFSLPAPIKRQQYWLLRRQKGRDGKDRTSLGILPTVNSKKHRLASLENHGDFFFENSAHLLLKQMGTGRNKVFMQGTKSINNIFVLNHIIRLQKQRRVSALHFFFQNWRSHDLCCAGCSAQVATADD